jgi:uncharacterized membrane protein
MEENVAGLLSYVLGWLTGLIFFLIDKRPFVRVPRHAIHHSLWRRACAVLHFFLRRIHRAARSADMAMARISWADSTCCFELALLVCWILCMVKAFQGQRFNVPGSGQSRENFAK